MAHRAVFVRFPLRGRPGENLLAWTTTPWTLSSNVAAAVNPELTYLKVLHKDQIYYLAKGAFTAHRLEEEFKRKEWVEGVPKLKTLEQIFKEKGGYEIVGEVKGADMVGWAYDGPFDELPAQHSPAGYPAETADVVRRQKWAPEKSAKEVHRVVAWKDVGETEGTGIVHIAPGCGKEDFHLGKSEGLPPVAPLDEFGCLPARLRRTDGQVRRRSGDHRLDSGQSQAKGRLAGGGEVSAQLPALLALQDGIAVPAGGRVVHQHGLARRDQGGRGAEPLAARSRSTARPASWTGSRNMGDWMISKKRFWGLALPIWVDEVTGDFEVIGSREELKERAVEGWDEFEGHTPHRPWIDQVKIRNPKTGNLHVAHPRRGQSVAGRGHRAAIRRWATTRTANTGRSGSRPTS